MDLKKQVFKQLDEITRKDVIISSNTSSMSITEIAKATTRADKVVGMHFFNPVPLMRLVEVVRGHYTSDRDGLIGNGGCEEAGQRPYRSENRPPRLCREQTHGTSPRRSHMPPPGGHSVEGRYRQGGQTGAQLSHGALSSCIDLTGVDILLDVVNYFFENHNKELKWVAPRLLKDTVKAGRMGMKTGAGWYDYPRK